MIKSKKQFKEIPKFKKEDEERDFWSIHDTTDYIDWSKALVNPEFPNLKPTTKSISLRLPVHLLDRIKSLANRRDVPYQSFIKIILDEKIQHELKMQQ
ncbi:BrnA antitoxin family protein [Candidatus Parcubacteria bacterium]|nr:BrnA antitoxin family protein [Patescibacteria group bacterium]MCG2686641.1 BrnA antitoxin family protein [Candidatus Parcubacteria bacterium]